MMIGPDKSPYPADVRQDTEAAYPIGYDHRVAELDRAHQRRDQLLDELSNLREKRQRFDEASDFDIRSREQTTEALAIVIDQLSAQLKSEQSTVGLVSART